jgi:hypothetical protein
VRKWCTRKISSELIHILLLKFQKVSNISPDPPADLGAYDMLLTIS